MSESRPAKRGRANLAGDAHVPNNEALTAQLSPSEINSQELRKEVNELNRNQLANIVLKAAESHRDVAAHVHDIVEAIREKERSRVINFDYESKDVWMQINVRYKTMSGSKQYEVAGDVWHYVTRSMKFIAGQCGPFGNRQTRFNGLSTLRKIGKTICLSSTDIVGHEVQKQFQWDQTLEDCMKRIVSGMSEDERKAIRQDESSAEALWPKLVELKKLARGRCIFNELDKVLDLIECGEGRGGDGEDEGEDDYENDQEEEDHCDRGDYFPQEAYLEDNDDYDEFTSDESDHGFAF